MLVVVNQPHTSFRIEGDIPVGILDYVGREYGKENIAVINDDGDELIDPHEMDFYKKAKAEETPGKNMRLFRRNLKMTQSELAEKLGTTKQAVSNMENGIRPISKKLRRSLQPFSRFPLVISSRIMFSVVLMVYVDYR